MGIGGMASARGITFTLGNRRVRVLGDNKGNLLYRDTKTVGSPAINRFAKIPFLRGLVAFGRIRPMLMLLALALLVDFVPFVGGAGADAAVGTASWVLLGMLAALVLARLFFLRDVLKYHAAEHMAINTYESGLLLTFENIARAPRTHPRCGTMLGIYVVLVAIPCAVFVPSVSLALVLTLSMSYELFLAAPNFRALRWLSVFGLWLQKSVTTAKPEPRHIETARAGLLRLLETAGLQ